MQKLGARVNAKSLVVETRVETIRTGGLKSASEIINVESLSTCSTLPLPERVATKRSPASQLHNKM